MSQILHRFVLGEMSQILHRFESQRFKSTFEGSNSLIHNRYARYSSFALPLLMAPLLTVGALLYSAGFLCDLGLRDETSLTNELSHIEELRGQRLQLLWELCHIRIIFGGVDVLDSVSVGEVSDVSKQDVADMCDVACDTLIADLEGDRPDLVILHAISSIVVLAQTIKRLDARQEGRWCHGSSV
jgi:hypothetical protein